MQQIVTIDIDQLLGIAARRGLNKQQLCDKAGLNRCIISRIKKSNGRARPTTAMKLIKAANG
jgi:transcriptional regulator with XRE-family HTH domain